MGYVPTKADPDLWMKDCGTHYEYIARYVDDVISFSKNPMAVIRELEAFYTMKGVGKPQYYLGGDVLQLGEEWEPEGIDSAFSAETYIRQCLPKLAKLCNKEYFPYQKVPFRDKYHPELDESPLCPPEVVSKFRALVGSANWVITLGRFDIAFATSTLSKYSMAPREGHYHAMQEVFGYLRRNPSGKLLIDITEPPVRKLAKFQDKQSWQEFYQDVEEDIPEDAPKPKGMTFTLTTYVDADHARDKLNRRSVTGIVMLINNTPLAWTSKRQKTVESSTYGSELVASRIATELVLAQRIKLRYLGARVEETSVMVGDNAAVIVNTTIPSSSLQKKHLSCAYHKTREAVAGDIMKFGHIPSSMNLADIATKPLGPALLRPLLEMYLFRRAKTTLSELKVQEKPNKTSE